MSIKRHRPELVAVSELCGRHLRGIFNAFGIGFGEGRFSREYLSA